MTTLALHTSSAARVSDVHSRDAMTAYLREVRNHPVLSHEEQIELAREFVKTADPKIAARLVTSNLRLVIKLAKELSHGRGSLEDLIQEGNLGLMHAIRKFDPEQGVKLSTYAAWWIRAYVSKSSRRAQRLVRIDTSHSHRALLPKLRREVAMLESFGVSATPKLLSERLTVPEEDISEMLLRLATREVSVDEQVGEGRNTMLDTIAANDVSAENSLVTHQAESIVTQKIAQFASKLSGRDSVIFERRLLADDPATLRGLGQELGISRERVRQIETAIEKKLKTYLRAELPEELLEAA